MLVHSLKKIALLVLFTLFFISCRILTLKCEKDSGKCKDGDADRSEMGAENSHRISKEDDLAQESEMVVDSRENGWTLK